MSPVRWFSDSVPDHAGEFRPGPEKEEVTPDLPDFLNLHLSFAKSHPRLQYTSYHKNTTVTTY